MSVDHASAVAAPKSDPVFLHVKAGITVIVTDTEGAWRMADVIWVDGGARNPKVATLFQVADVDTGGIDWVNIHLTNLTRPIRGNSGSPATRRLLPLITALAGGSASNPSSASSAKPQSRCAAATADESSAQAGGAERSCTS